MEYQDNPTQEDIQLQTGEWVITEATQLIKNYRECETEHEKNRMRGKLEYMKVRLAFEGKQLQNLLSQNGE